MNSPIEVFNYNKLCEKLDKKFNEKVEELFELIEYDYSFEVFKEKYLKLKKYVYAIEELKLKEKLCYKRALNLCLILLK
jgi:hypothetical protein